MKVAHHNFTTHASNLVKATYDDMKELDVALFQTVKSTVTKNVMRKNFSIRMLMLHDMGKTRLCRFIHQVVLVES